MDVILDGLRDNNVNVRTRAAWALSIVVGNCNISHDWHEFHKKMTLAAEICLGLLQNDNDKVVPKSLHCTSLRQRHSHFVN